MEFDGESGTRKLNELVELFGYDVEVFFMKKF